MTDKEREEMLMSSAVKFTELDEDMKDKIAWYLLGKKEERAKQEAKEKQLA